MTVMDVFFKYSNFTSFLYTYCRSNGLSQKVSEMYEKCKRKMLHTDVMFLFGHSISHQIDNMCLGYIPLI